MKSKRLRDVCIIFLSVLAMALGSCALGNRLDIKSTTESSVKGSYTLILYGCTYQDDLETIAILAKEGSPYVFEPFAPDFNYRTIKGVPAKEALEGARKFVGCHTGFHRAQLGELVDAKGDSLGFEVRPLYFPFVFGMDDVLDTDYRIKDGKVVVKIKLLPSVGKMLSGGSEGHDRGQ
jgi:hypothetical protein